MSQTIPTGVVGASYWSYMAAVMAESLKKIIQVKQIREGDIPKGVYHGAQEFFGLVLPAMGDDIPENPDASVNIYIIAADAVIESAGDDSMTDEELKERLQRYSSFVDRLLSERTLNIEEVGTAEELRKFFFQLMRVGDIEAY